MKKRCQAHFTLIELLIVIAIIAILAAMLLPALNSARKTAKMAQCTSNCKQFAQSNHLYATSFNGYVTPITNWDAGNGTNIWPALIWNQLGSVAMPTDKSTQSYESSWGEAVKASKLFQCPADTDASVLSDNKTDMPKLSYAISRCAVFKLESGSDTVKKGAAYKVTKFLDPSNMIYVCDTNWSRGAGATKGYGRLYSRQKVSGFSFFPGSIVHAWDQAVLGYEDNNSNRGEALYKEATGNTAPWHVGKSWNYSFVDGHASHLRPEQSHCGGGDPSKPGTMKDVYDNTPNGKWTWNHRNWGES